MNRSMVKEWISEGEVEECLNCILPDCDENDPLCKLYHKFNTVPKPRLVPDSLREKRALRARLWRKKNPELDRKSKAGWRAKNKDKIREYSKAYRKKKKGAKSNEQSDTVFRLQLHQNSDHSFSNPGGV